MVLSNNVLLVMERFVDLENYLQAKKPLKKWFSTDNTITQYFTPVNNESQLQPGIIVKRMKSDKSKEFIQILYIYSKYNTDSTLAIKYVTINGTCYAEDIEKSTLFVSDPPKIRNCLNPRWCTYRISTDDPDFPTGHRQEGLKMEKI